MPSSFLPHQGDTSETAAITDTPNSSGLSSALARSSSSAAARQQWTCPCLNVRLNLAPGSSPASVSTAGGSRPPWLAELASDDAIHIQYPALTSRETVTIVENTSIACAKCLNCDTVVYAASKPAPPGPARALGFNTSSSLAADSSRESSSQVSPTAARTFRSPSRDRAAAKPDRLNAARTNEPLVRPLDRKVWILPDALDPQQASSAASSQAFSPAFNVLIPRTNLSLIDPANRSATVPSVSDRRRDLTPTRPSAAAAHARNSSYNAGTSSIAYTLPAVPQHLITSSPLSPHISGPSSTFSSSANAPTSPGAGASPAPSNLASSSNSAIATNPLASQLDSVAIERLKDMRSKAEAEVFELVRQKRREMEQLEKRFREEAETLLAVTKLPKQSKSNTSNGSTASLIEKALIEQKQPQPQPLSASGPANTFAGASTQGGPALASSGFAADNHLRSTGGAPPRDISGAQSSVASSGRRDSITDEYSDLPPSAFERRPTYTNPSTSNSTAATTNGSAPPAVASSLGGLSASFAMRGRELPPQMQDWAEKRRLRERYPQGDHSALPSAANSNVNSAANSIGDSDEDAWPARNGGARVQEQHRLRESSINTEEDAEMDHRGRGRQPSRQRGGSSSREPREPRRPEGEQQQPPSNAISSANLVPSSEAIQDLGRGRVGRPAHSTFNPPPAMSSSLLAKRPAMAYVDDGRDADENTPSVGGKLISPRSIAEPSAQVTLRPRDPPPSTAEPLKPATRSTAVSTEESSRGRSSGSGASSNPRTASGAGGSDSPRSRKASEKKVAFAETEDRVDHTVVSDDEDGDDDDAEASAQRSNGGPLSGRAHHTKLPLVDESADAVFEIDEEAEDVDLDEDGNAEEAQMSPEDSDRHKVEMSQSGLRTGASGRPRGQADDPLPGFEDDIVDQPGHRRGPGSGSLSDDFRSSSSDDDEDAVPPGFGAASFSALAASQSAMHTLASSLARARADDASFDPASLRMDGRVRVPPPSAVNRDLDGVDADSFVVGSLRSSSRRMSVQLPSSTTPSSRQGGEAIEGVQSHVSGAVAGSSRGQRSSSRTRISNMSKEDADTEVRLSGLLAPNAPSHRSLWSPKEAKARRAGKHKYKLNDEDNQKWDLWKRKVGSDDASAPTAAEALAKDSDDKNDARSTPMAVAPPTQYIAASSGIGPRPLREATMIDPDYSSSTSTFSAFDRHLQARAAAATTAGATTQAPATVSGGLSIGKKTWGYGSFKDDTSGFETEPKTSLPYKEKMMVPSLRKALRRSIYEPEPHVKLATIPDADDASTSVSAGKATGTATAPSGTSALPISRDGALKREATPADAATPAAPGAKDAEHKGALPGSVITRGFHMPGAAGTRSVSPTTKAPESIAVSVATGLGIPSVSTSNKSTVVPAERTTQDVAVGPSLPGSGAETPSSFGRRSPRPPYVAPPPPTSATTVLESDPAQHPRPLKLFQTDADTSFRLHEDGEEEETEEGWSKVIKFMHVVEQLKTNKRTGWLHHRVPAPESIADHMYRMAMLSLLCPAEADVDLGKCVQLAIVHDLAEAEVGDLTPLDGVNKHEKMRREKEAIQYFVHDLLGSSAAGLRIEALWEEYEARETKESKLVKDLDRFELSLQAMEYERRYGIDDLQAFWEGSIPHVGHPRIRKWAQELARERAELWQERGRAYEQ
ncbi:hypothetical protein EX895_000644 [Sporisorium graminicola]|uniref:5'-deoxynucleotidase n=1 Tax=Sporisorium graminicola TaxID=280036 RepID=A0A4U7L1L9_9BASI|nr:hypothetical protein EX895_000644 [Sporisorium graminicola]TKY90646.1 hypothetical protein EX895_000644 [Sporisorium graminicola]